MTEYSHSLARCRSYSLTRCRSRSTTPLPGQLSRVASVPSIVPSFKPFYESYLNTVSPTYRYQRDRTLDYYKAYNRYKTCTPYTGPYYPRYFLNTNYIGSHSYYWGNLNAYYPQYRSNLNDYGSNKYISSFYDNYHKPSYPKLWYSRSSAPYYHSSYRYSLSNYY